MPTTKAEIKKLVTRLVQLPAQDSTMFGVAPEDIRESLGKALERYAASDDHATRMVDWLIFDRDPDQRKFRPTPGEIKDASESVSRVKIQQGEGICQSCEGRGFHLRGQVLWQEKRPDETLRRCREIVADEDLARQKASEMPAEARAQGLSCAVDCACRKAAVPA